MPDTPPTDEAPRDLLPPLLAEPPWTKAPRDREPVVLKGLKVPDEPTAVLWGPGEREEWAGEGRRNYPPPPEGTDWDGVLAAFPDPSAAYKESRPSRAPLYGLLLYGPEDLARTVLADERYYRAIDGTSLLQGIAARFELAALPLLLHADNKWTLSPFRNAEVAQRLLKLGDNTWQDPAPAYFAKHGPAAATLIIPDALRRPGPRRARAERLLRVIADAHGVDAVLDAARPYGEETRRAVATLQLDPLERFPDPLPKPGFDPADLPPVLLRGTNLALPEDAVRHLVTMLLISTPDVPYAGVEPVIEACDPASLAEFAWALYEAHPEPKSWAAPGVQYALRRLGDDRTAARLAVRVARWDKAMVYSWNGTSALYVFTSIGTDAALRHLHRLSQKATDKKRIRPWAQSILTRIAEERGLSAEQLADRLVPDLGLDAEGGMTLDYGPRRFRVGFDEHLKPVVTGEDGKRRKSLPKPGAKDDPELAPAAHRRFAELKKEARTVVADQVRRLEAAMVKGRRWTAEEFETVLLGHPLLWQVARRLVWASGGTAFRVAEDRSLADAADDAFALVPGADVELPHPLRLKDVDAWARVFADYEILQPFPQLGRAVHTLTDEERGTGRLARFEGRIVHFGKILGLADRGWKLGEKETGGFRRHVSLELAADRHVVIDLDPGVRVIAPDEYAEQQLTSVRLFDRPYGKQYPFGDLDPVAASELLAELTRLTDTPAK
ncbi:DUF4132 domain-containing protein [Actinomadura fibrosa]|uniref:DUF4132 domain-containing protein n=1 Tax=Actinomadura fibrosa TaxID=111802 RepID=A0ABW2XJH2_9ACTN|nr:DUF4132 domain-containing protein [Actinomadura fibrosa]